MALPKSVKDAKGLWNGTSKLHLSWLEGDKKVQASASGLHIDVDQHGAFATLTYNWVYEGKTQEGVLVLAGDEKKGVLTGGWSDSWHQGTGVMFLTGSGFGTSPVSLSGKYDVEDSQPWGWRIDLIFKSATAMVLKMTNITPDGEEEWAVSSEYARKA